MSPQTSDDTGGSTSEIIETGAKSQAGAAGLLTRREGPMVSMSGDSPNVNRWELHTGIADHLTKFPFLAVEPVQGVFFPA
jgi:hypothetical protein